MCDQQELRSLGQSANNFFYLIPSSQNITIADNKAYEIISISFLCKENQKEKKLTNRGRCIALRYYNNNHNIQRESFASQWKNCNKTFENGK